VTEFRPITGEPCDVSHPYPTPTDSDLIDSMEYGNDHRLPGNSMWDRDSAPIWRAIAAYMWGQPCYERHLADVAADPILAAHTIAVTVLAADPSGRGSRGQSPFYQLNAETVFNALKAGGQQSARHAVDGLSVVQRIEVLNECVIYINHGFNALRRDIGAVFGGKP
jgi:hypothetical protein